VIVIPAIDLRGGHVVRLRQGRPEAETTYGDDPVVTARTFTDVGAAWLHVVDLDAALGSGDNRVVVGDVIDATSARVQVGGGIRSLDAARELVDTGASRVVLGTGALEEGGFLEGAVAELGETLVIALDVDGDRVRIGGWTADAGSLDEVLPRVRDAGVSRVLATQVSRDGTLEGPDLELYERLVDALRAHVIASGGVRDVRDLRALAGTGVEAVIVGRALYEGRLTLADALEAVA
jgi:phosphoribosylformimino-5-aminoimidazole carboxamide ribotide isomerase